jgi:hypothetical protein
VVPATVISADSVNASSASPITGPVKVAAILLSNSKKVFASACPLGPTSTV